MNASELQFTRLTRLVLDGIATDAERAELSNLSAENPVLVTSVADELVIDALLKWQSGSVVEVLPSLEDGVASSYAPPNRRSRSRAYFWMGMVAAALLIASGVALSEYAAKGAADRAVADIVNQQNVRWSKDSTALTANATVRCGRLASSGGEYTLRFRDGSTVRVVGYSSLDIKSNKLLQLNHGQATANVAYGGSGFTITSSLVDVVDRGTEFGISIDGNRADVVVFDGKVDVQSKLGGSSTQQRLTQGEAVKVDHLGSFTRLVDICRDVDGRWWSGNRPDPTGHVIARVSDNIHAEGGGGDTFFCYQTTFEGLREDALAYSDNPNHQWNGLTAEGLPKFLLGADYIRTFNDYRYMPYFKMTVEFSQPANLYVFADDRIPPPDWLTRQFEDTGVDIGLDEGPWGGNVEAKYRKDDVNTTDIGPGKSIDNVFSVWWRRCADGKPITLGDAGAWGGEGGQGRAMYGVAATPLDVDNVTCER